ncbi:RNA polymerase II subunit A C-terminal domain phosphatase [Leptopilina heterotoma]|uniref:RNA polymerase II subunit A C-terminal domain phosphatase n=1 Tax=Leptopilina heterotoma TaxID=63436 RepID=UPI001CA9F29C|nr:RNA polymerase II subunit A C-terminal domain phosphatase [Leptopilina heterotoma]
MSTTEVTFSCKKPAKIVKWKVSPGTMVSPGKVLLLYKTLSTNNDDNKNVEEKLRSKTERGLVKKFLAKSNDIVQPGQGILLLEACKHNTVMKDLCADCGVDLREGDGVVECQASISMVHSIPELKVCPELAQQIGKEDEQRLLSDKKLALLVDLDQTIVHTTNDDVDPNIKDVYHYKLPSQRSQWYHTRLRPHTLHFLREMSKLYELHICTFGVREYAHTVAALLDKNGELFSHRILSRNECFDPGSKYPNLKALFPCGDEMVCIIDDREDVWQGCRNLVQVKPYFFFQHSANIHAPPGMNKVNDQRKLESYDCSESPEENEDDKNGVTEEVYQEDEVEDIKPETKIDSEQDEEMLTDDITKEQCSEITNETKEKVKDIPTDSDKTENSEETETKVNEVSKENETQVNESSPEIETKTNEVKEPETKSNEISKETETTETKCDESAKETVTEDADQAADDAEKLSLEEKEEKYVQEKDTKGGDESNADVECEDQDDYLLYLEDILRRIHTEYYTDLENEKERRSLCDVILKVRAKVLQGLTLTFSGIIPIHQKLHQSRAYKVAQAFGAQVTQDLMDETTHLVAMKPGTQKVNTAKKRGNIKVVNPDWLWTCAERWEHVDERLYTLSSKVRGSRIPPPHCSNPESSRKRSEKNSFANTINPLYFVSEEEINDMDKEVEEDMNDIELDFPIDDQDNPNELRLKRDHESSESDSAEDSCPTVVKRLKKNEDSSESDVEINDRDDNIDVDDDESKENSQQDDDEDDDPIVRFRRGEGLPDDLDLGDISEDSVEIDDTEDYEDEREWNAMGEALEREFLSD